MMNTTNSPTKATKRSSLMRRWRNERGSVITTAAIFSGVTVIVMGSILGYVTTERGRLIRAQDWNEAMSLAEAAVEIGLSELNYNHAGGAGFKSSEGWQSSGGGIHNFKVSGFKDNFGTVLGDLSVTVNIKDKDYPEVMGTGTRRSWGGQPITRTLKVGTVRRGSRYAAMAGKIKMKPGSVIDSFDSGNSNKSTGGRYDRLKRKTNGDLFLSSGMSKQKKTDLQIKGHVYGEAKVLPDTKVKIEDGGTLGPNEDNKLRARDVPTAIAKGWLTEEAGGKVQFVGVPAPVRGATSLGKVNTSRTIAAGDWRVDELKIDGSNRTVTIGPGTVRLYITGDVEVKDNAQIVLLPNSRLQVYYTKKVKIEGKGMNNQTNLAWNNQWYGQSKAKEFKIKVNGNEPFIGTIFSPRTKVVLEKENDMSGIVIARQLELKENARLHYDEGLTSLGGLLPAYPVRYVQLVRQENGQWVAEY